MLKQFVVSLENRPGKLGELVSLLGKEGVNILGVDCEAVGEFGNVRLVVGDEAKAQAALRNAGHHFRVFDVLAVRLPNRPGELARACERLGRSGVNIEGVFGTTSEGAADAELILRVNDIATAKKALNL